MNIILNERDWAENVISARNLGKHPIETLSRVARYYRQHEGYSRNEVRDKLEDFMIQCDPTVILVKWSDVLDQLAKTSAKCPLISIEEVCVTEAEIGAVKSLAGVQKQRLAFTMLCVAKYWDAVNAKNNGWVNTQDVEILRMANIKPGINGHNLMLHEMKNAGMVSFGKRVDSLNIRVKYIYPDSPVVLRITDFRNLGNQYMMYLGESYFQCVECGLVVRRITNNQKYCDDCAASVYVRKSVESALKNYYKKKSL